MSALGKSLSALLCVLVLAGMAWAEDDLSIARQALRDGLWEVARAHAMDSADGESQLIVLESYAREERWNDILKFLSEREVSSDGGFVYYGALARYRIGDVDGALAWLARGSFEGTAFAPVAARLEAQIRLGVSDAEGALKALAPHLADDSEAQMLAAEAATACGSRLCAEKLWQRILVNTNASEQTQAVAATRLVETNVLARLVAGAESADVRLQAGLALGLAQARTASGAAEGMRLVRSIVRDAPDAPGAKAAFLALADAAFDRNDCETAAAIYSDALEMWPDLSKRSSVLEGRGWALDGLGRHQEALEAFRLADELATNVAAKAMIRVKCGDVLSALGRMDEAMSEYRAVSETYPETPAGKRVAEVIRIREREAEGRRDFKAYRFSAAQKTFAEVARSDPSRSARMAFYDVLCLYGQGCDGEAEKKAREIVATCTDETVGGEATLWLAKFSYNRGKWRDAEQFFATYAGGDHPAEESADAWVWAARAAFAAGDWPQAVQSVTQLVTAYPDTVAAAKGLVVQGEALIEMARFDEAVLVFDRAAALPTVTPEDRQRAHVLRADALFAMGADNPTRYQEALEAYRALRLGETLGPSAKLTLAYKIAKTLEKLKRMEEAVDQYYSQVVLAYRNGRSLGILFDDESRAAFSRAAFRLAEEFESRGRDSQAAHVLELVEKSDVPAAEEASRRRERLMKKGSFL